MPIPFDTSSGAEQVQLQLLAEMTPQQPAELASRLSDQIRNASRRAIARAHPDLSPRASEYKFIELHYGKEMADGVRATREVRGF